MLGLGRRTEARQYLSKAAALDCNHIESRILLNTIC
jgi:hypothetical protein